MRERRWPWLLAAALMLALAVALPISDATANPDDSLPTMVILTIELAAVIALVAISTWQPDLRGRGVLRLLVVLWGTTAFGFVHGIPEYMIMIKFSDAYWDSPPGTGYLTIATIAISAILTAIMTLRTPRRSADHDQHQDHHSGSLTVA